MTARRERGFLLAWVAVLALGVGLIWPGRSLEAQDVAPGTAQNGSIQGTTSATCSVYRATGGAIVIAGTWVGTLQFESSVDGVNYLALPVTPQAGGSTVTSTAANGTWNFTNAGYNSPSGVRVRASAWTSGLATINRTTVGATYLLTNNTTTTLGPGTVDVPNIQTTSTDALLLRNITPSVAAVTVQMSPRLRWCGSAYNSVSTLSETDCMFAEVLPATAAGATTQLWKLGSTINGGAATYPLTVSSAGVLTALAGINAGAANEVTGLNFLAGASGALYWNGRALLKSPSDGNVSVTNQAGTIGSQIKADALPTVASGFGTSPAVTAGSTPYAGSINVGTGGTANTGNINFNGTAFPSAPFCVVTNALSSAVPSQAISSTTQLNIFASSAWVANQVVSWICVSSK